MSDVADDLDASGGDEPILSPEFAARLERLEILLARALPSNRRGDRRSPMRKGISLEFADFRGYVEGDDVRHLDWAGYARLDQLIVKLYHDEEDVQLHLVVDATRSMDYGTPTKARRAREIAAAFAWIGLAHDHRVSLTLIGDALVAAPLVRGRGSFARLAAPLAETPSDGTRGLAEGAREFVRRFRPRGIVVLVSDLLDPEGPESILRALEGSFRSVVLLQVLAREETDPTLEGDLRLIDSETNARVEVHADDALLDAYRRRVRSFIALCSEVARRRGAAFATHSTEATLEEFVLRTLVGEGVLR